MSKTLILFCNTIFFLLFQIIGFSQPENDLWNGHRTFAEGMYDSAVYYYQSDIDNGNDWEWMPEMIETVIQRKNLGVITPEVTQNIMTVFVIELNEITYRYCNRH